jgi:hypothetical protein
MNGYEARKVAEQERRYQNSKAGKLALERDRERRRARDRKLGHVEGCSLTRCATGCTSVVAHIIVPRGF